MPEPVHNVLSGNIGASVQAGDIHGDVNFNVLPSTGPGLGSLAPPALTHDVRGRGELVAEVVEELRAGRSCVLHGAGGYGKTTVAQQVAAELGAEAWWVDASSERSLHDGLREVALRAGASPQEVHEAWEGRGHAPDLLWRQLAQVEFRWLLVLDNADDVRVLGAGRPIAERTGWLRASTGSVLITSRDGNPQSWGGLARLHAIETLSVADGAQMLLDRAPDAGSAESAGDLARRLAGLPLALHLAGQYLAVVATMPQVPGLDLPVDFDSYRTALDDRWPEVTELLETPYPLTERETLHRTWELSLDLLAERGYPTARPLLRLLSHFADAPIPLEVLRTDILAKAPVFAEITAVHLAAAIKALAGVGLLSSDSLHGPEKPVPVLRLHPVVRETNRYVGSPLERGNYMAHSVALLAEMAANVEETDPATWPRWRILLPHCTAMLDLPVVLRARMASMMAWTCERATRFCSTAGLALQGIDLARTALSYLPDTEVEALHHLLNIRNNLAVLLLSRGELNEAEVEFRAVWESAPAIFGENYANLLGVRNNIAAVLQDRGEYERAESEFRAVAELAAEALGAESTATLTARHHLAGALRFCGRLAEAKAEYQAVLELRGQVLGAEHIHTMTTRSDLASVLSDLGESALAEAEFRKVLDWALNTLEDNHPRILITRANLAGVLSARGALEQAESELRAVLTAADEVLGADHVHVRTVRDQLANVLLDQGKRAEAEAVLREARAADLAFPKPR
ncbi:Tetratricopeptide repeat-containing protein [Saccharopolyspora kobensis]|uniref:Tetratricopeptide repeat-containing protein n=1 Tax=Saccharopolyspora kobensis TaxID=146035 RepID=A0A1H6EF64_9PSEU|nr:tetratricopeptide repeat protein [Saccharopolyspora kobensis]SEG96430.1 Tetratricopeptide repeat-containing protein [Saccharopolyspora kobensis]SFD19269.1 Tetratricopeptide repeat-containing protein [Saccharopolyspora kobensis]